MKAPRARATSPARSRPSAALSIDIPHEPLTPDELNTLGAIAATGDTAAADRIARAFVNPIGGWAADLVRKNRVLTPWKDEIAGDGFLILARRLRHYDPAKGDLLPFVVATVKPGMARESKRFLATNGAHVETGGGGAGRGKVRPDYKGNPCFAATCALNPFDAAPEVDDEAKTPKAKTPEEIRIGTRYAMMKLMGNRLVPFEKEVVCRMDGIAITRPSCNPWARRDSMHAFQESAEDVAASHEIHVDEVRAAYHRAKEKLAAPTRAGASVDPRLSSFAQRREIEQMWE